MDAPSMDTAARRGIPLALAGRCHAFFGTTGLVAVVVIVGLAAVSAFAPWIAPYDPQAMDLANVYASPSPAHLLGTDGLGRDLLSRLIYGGRTTFIGPLGVIIISTVIGSALGIASAWVGGKVDGIIARFLDIMFALPGIIFALVAVAIYGPGLTSAVLGLAVSYTPYCARIVRGAALRERSLPYIAACSVQGFSSLRVCVRHILPNLRSLIIAQAVASLGFAVVELAGVSFLGLGVQPPTPDWGVSVSVGLQSALQGYPAEALYAGSLIILVVVAFNVLGDSLTARAERTRR
jgi:peptide/nickel transport system permease protein